MEEVKTLLIIICVVIISIFILLLMYGYGKAKYEDGFGVGVLVALRWVQDNTDCKDAIEIYRLVSQSDPDSSIYICELDDGGRIRIQSKPKKLKIDKI